MKEKTYFHRFVARYRKNRFLTRLLRITGKDLHPQKWVFIVGCYNSGTTLFEKILSFHSDVSALNDEGVILTDQLKRPEDFGYHRLWVPVAHELSIDPESSESAKKAEAIKKHWSHFFNSSKSVFVEKSISNATRIDFLEKFFKPAYFLYIIRNGYAVSQGIRSKADPRRFDRNGMATYPLAMCSQQWRESDVLIRKTLEGKRHMTVSYEQLTEKTCETISAVCRFLELSPIDCAELKKPISIHGSTSTIRNMNDSSIQKLTADEIKIIRDNASDVLDYYRYTP